MTNDKVSHTPGPWRWEVNRKHKSVKLCGGLPAGTYDKTVISFERYGMHGAAPVFHNWTKDGWGGAPCRADDLAVPAAGREHHSDWFALINHPNARLIAAAPDLLDALKLAADVIASYHATTGIDLGDASRMPFYDDTMRVVSEAIAKATGEAK